MWVTHYNKLLKLSVHIMLMWVSSHCIKVLKLSVHVVNSSRCKQSTCRIYQIDQMTI